VERGLLKFLAARPQSVGLDYYLGAMVDLADTHHPTLVAIDPMSALNCVGTQSDARGLIMRIINILKSRKITGIFTSLTNDGERSAEIEAGITSLIDTWILVRNLEQNGERTRGLTVLKARGVKHSNQIREMILTNRGVTFAPIYVGPEGVLTGSARAAQDVLDKAANQAARKHAQLRKAVLTAKRKAIAAKTIEMESEYAIVAEENARSVAENTAAQMRVLARRGNQSTEQERAGAKK
jgi:circadian clock protein KaiC